MKKFLIVGLGNVGEEYTGTRHNIGFDILDNLISNFEGDFKEKLAADCTGALISIFSGLAYLFSLLTPVLLCLRTALSHSRASQVLILTHFVFEHVFPSGMATAHFSLKSICKFNNQGCPSPSNCTRAGDTHCVGLFPV